MWLENTSTYTYMLHASFENLIRMENTAVQQSAFCGPMYYKSNIQFAY